MLNIYIYLPYNQCCIYLHVISIDHFGLDFHLYKEMVLLTKQPWTTSNFLLYGWDVKFSSIYTGMSSGMVSTGLVQGAILLRVIVCNNLVLSCGSHSSPQSLTLFLFIFYNVFWPWVQEFSYSYLIVG